MSLALYLFSRKRKKEKEGIEPKKREHLLLFYDPHLLVLELYFSSQKSCNTFP